jgi:hypothetical protein
MAYNLSVQVTARAEPFCHIGVKFKIIVLMKAVVAWLPLTSALCLKDLIAV